MESIALCIRWWSVAVKHYTLCDAGEMTNKCVNAIYDNLQVANELKAEFKKEYFKVYNNFDKLREKIEIIPEILFEKKIQIEGILDEIENAELDSPNPEGAPQGDKPEE